MTEDTWVVLASGPSMSQEIADMVKGFHVIAVSNTYELAPWAEVLVSNDKKWWTHNPKALEFEGEKFCGLTIEPPHGVTKFSGAMTGSNSGLLALQVAVNKGAKTILLFGVDLQGTHYFGDHPEILRSKGAARFPVFQKQFAQYKPKGVEIFNCSPNSQLKAYPFRDIQDFLPEPEPEPEPLPVGAQGERGLPGTEGKAGDRGPRGPEGPPGPRGPMPDHQWDGTRLRFEEPEGGWGRYVDLRGPQGHQGASGIGGNSGEGMTPLQVLQLQTLLDIFGGWIATAPTATIDEVAISGLEVDTEGSATGFYTGIPSGLPVDAQWEWDWGDGSSSTTQDASHTYAADGEYTIRFRAHNHISWGDWVEEVVNVAAPTDGVLSMTSLQTNAAVDLTAIGTIDWTMYTDLSGVPSQRKAGVTPRIGSVVGFGGTGFNAGGGVSMSWSDGDPTPSGSSSDGIYRISIDNTSGIDSLNNAAGTAEWILRLGLGCYNGTIMVDASLSDGSATPIVGYDTGIVGTGGAQLDGWVDIRYKTATSAQTLSFRLWANGSTTPFSTAVTIQYAALRAA